MLGKISLEEKQDEERKEKEEKVENERLTKSIRTGGEKSNFLKVSQK